MKRTMVRFRGAREKGAIIFVKCLGVSREDTMEGPLWRETFERSLGLHDAAELVGEICHGNGCRQETPTSTPYLAQRRDEALSLTIGFLTRQWFDPLTRVKSSLLRKNLNAAKPPE